MIVGRIEITHEHVPASTYRIEAVQAHPTNASTAANTHRSETWYALKRNESASRPSLNATVAPGVNDALESTSSSAGSPSGLADHKPLPYTPSELATCAYGSKSPIPALFNSIHESIGRFLQCQHFHALATYHINDFLSDGMPFKYVARHQTGVIILSIGGRS